MPPKGKTKRTTTTKKRPISGARVAKRIDDYLRKNYPDSPLIGLGKMFVKYGEKYNVSPYLLAGIAGKETQFGTAANTGQDVLPGHNVWGMGPHIQYPSWAAGMEATARNLGENYIGEGLNTIQEIGGKWAPVGAANDPTGLNPSWSQGVQHFVSALGGDPGRTVYNNQVAALEQGFSDLTGEPAAPPPISPLATPSPEASGSEQALLSLLSTGPPPDLAADMGGGPAPLRRLSGTGAQPEQAPSPAPGPLSGGMMEKPHVEPGVEPSGPPPVGGMNQEFINRFDQLQAAVRAEGGDITIYSGSRDEHEQQAMFDEALATYGSESAAKKWVAPPDKSHHHPQVGVRYGLGEGALAGDVRGDLQLAHKLAPMYGIVFPDPMQPWHAELAGLKQMKRS